MSGISDVGGGNAFVPRDYEEAEAPVYPQEPAVEDRSGVALASDPELAEERFVEDSAFGASTQRQAFKEMGVGLEKPPGSVNESQLADIAANSLYPGNYSGVALASDPELAGERFVEDSASGASTQRQAFKEMGVGLEKPPGSVDKSQLADIAANSLYPGNY